jgi:group I intron endonuclease
MKTVIYTLTDPTTGEIRYVGKTKSSLTYRLSQHIHDSLNNGTGTHKKAWIKGLILKGVTPTIEILDVVQPKMCWKELEQYWISQLKAWGYSLVNMTAGGDGNQQQVMSEESKLKRSQSLKGRKRPEHIVAKIKQAHLGKKLSEDTKQKLRLHNLGKIQSEETKRKRYKPVLLVEADGTVIKEFPSLQHAAIKHGCRRGQIANVCAGRTKSACGLIWKYKV